jgi:hypothetical protein
VYIPIGGNRVSKGRQVYNLLILWLLTGLWHGAHCTFIVWGLFYFLLLVAERFTGIDKKPGALSRVYTLFFVLIGWVLFRSESLPLAFRYLGAMFGLGRGKLIDETFIRCFSNGKWILAAGILLSTPLVPFCRQKLKAAGGIYQAAAALALAAIFCLSILVCVKSDYNPFLYFNF